MEDFKTTVIEDRKNSRISELSDVAYKNRLSWHGAISGFTESAVMGFSLFLAFVIQKIYFDLNDHQFLIGQSELIRMSIGMAFCYAFVFVLRRGHISGLSSHRKDTAGRLTQYIVESYVVYLALLFLVRDINFRSVKLALGIGIIISAILLFSYGFAFSVIFAKKKMYPGQRKITLKKSPFPPALNRQLRSEGNIKADDTFSHSDDPRFDTKVKGNMTFNSTENNDLPGLCERSEKS